MMKKLIGCLASATLLFAVACSQSPAEQDQSEKAQGQEQPATSASKMVTAKSDTAGLEVPAEAAAGSTFQVSWTGPDQKRDYITIVEKGTATGQHGNYTYTSKGSPLELMAPDTPGAYEVRYVSGESRDTLVSADVAVTEVTASLDVPGEVGAGSGFEVSWTGPDNSRDYVTIVEEGAPEGVHGNYAYTKKGSPLQLTAPDTAGKHEVRYVMGQSKRVLASAPVNVTAAEAGVSVSGDAMVDAPIEVSWKGPDNSRDYIAIVEAGAPEGRHINYTYTSKGNPLTLQGPKTPGRYEIRYVMGQSKKTLAGMPVTVKPLSATLEAPDEAAPGASLEVEWSGPNNPRDYIAVAKPDAPFDSYESRALSQAGSPAALFAPGTPGKYEVRYVLAKTKQILASVPVTVAKPQQ